MMNLNTSFCSSHSGWAGPLGVGASEVCGHWGLGPADRELGSHGSGDVSPWARITLADYDVNHSKIRSVPIEPADCKQRSKSSSFSEATPPSPSVPGV
ncbi:unnamed protein product [Lota lota]